MTIQIPVEWTLDQLKLAAAVEPMSGEPSQKPSAASSAARPLLCCAPQARSRNRRGLAPHRRLARRIRRDRPLIAVDWARSARRNSVQHAGCADDRRSYRHVGSSGGMLARRDEGVDYLGNFRSAIIPDGPAAERYIHHLGSAPRCRGSVHRSSRYIGSIHQHH